jgi:hypothetical protein
MVQRSPAGGAIPTPLRRLPTDTETAVMFDQLRATQIGSEVRFACVGGDTDACARKYVTRRLGSDPGYLGSDPGLLVFHSPRPGNDSADAHRGRFPRSSQIRD